MPTTRWTSARSRVPIVLALAAMLPTAGAAQAATFVGTPTTRTFAGCAADVGCWTVTQRWGAYSGPLFSPAMGAPLGWTFEGSGAVPVGGGIPGGGAAGSPFTFNVGGAGPRVDIDDLLLGCAGGGGLIPYQAFVVQATTCGGTTWTGLGRPIGGVALDYDPTSMAVIVLIGPPGQSLLTGTGVNYVTRTVTLTAVPEPATFALVGVGLLTLGAASVPRRRAGVRR